MPSTPLSPPFVLASRSPRRVQFLQEAGYAFVTDPADVPEHPGVGEPAADYALRVAIAKARTAALRHPDLAVLGADTDVVLQGRILGKPANAQEASDMLGRLSAATHEVISAVAVVQGERLASCITVTRIEFVRLTAADIAAYVASGEPMGKAGAYGIQGLAARFVRSVQGSYTGVVGLPLAETCELLASFGIQPSTGATIAA